MFRAAAPGPYDEAVAKATDENLTSEDWGSIMEVCDRVSGDANGSQQAVQALIKRLAHRNANVQLYTLEVANALSQNCGKPMHRELASRAFTDALLKLANDRNTHNQVKAKILERMKEWSDMFSKDADLGIMYDAYFRLKQSNPQLQPPSAPQKNSLTDVDRQKEEDELQIALKLSLQEEERKKSAQQPASAGPSSSAGPPEAAPAAPLQPMPSGTTAATVSRVRALYDFVPSEPGELEFKRGDVIAVLESVYKDWWRGSLKGKTGIFPLNYVEKLTDPTPDELQREAQMEAEVFAEIKNVEKLLTLLSTNSAPREEDNEEISKLYHQTLAIRPKLIKLIEKYSQKKDDFTQLNEKFIKARRDYEALLESSMSHPPQSNYGPYAMRPAIPQGYGGPPGPGYPGQGPPPQQEPQGYGPPPGPGYPQQQQQQPPQDPQRFYTPAPAQEQQQQPPPHQQPHQYQAYPPQQHPQSTPSPAFQRPSATPAPFYMAGAEVPATANQHQYPPQNQGQRVPSAGKQPDVPPIQTNTSPPPAGQYVPYSRPPIPGSQPPPQDHQRPQSTYGPGSGPSNPQELATSVYDSPIASHNPQSAATYTSSAYSPDDGPSAPSEPSYPAPSAPSAPSAPGVPGSLMPGAPPPLQPSGAAYDARRASGGQSHYKPYVPPSNAY
ncbi:VHS domain-containing protein [Diaporthe sp. PMI_573]|nr:VHS domain-containing protein [Diaporthaceae sp. PMI_573]